MILPGYSKYAIIFESKEKIQKCTVINVITIDIWPTNNWKCRKY